MLIHIYFKISTHVMRYLLVNMRNNSGACFKSLSSFRPSHQTLSSPSECIFNQELINQLRQSLHQLHIFIESLEHKKNTPLIPDICDQYSSAQVQRLTPEKVMKLSQARIEKMIKNRKIKKNWSSSDIQLLVWILSKYLEAKMMNSTDEMSAGDWKQISYLIPGSTPNSCQFRWLSLQKTKLSQNQWKTQEATILKILVQQLGSNNWRLVSENLYMQNQCENKVYRNAKQCREYWSCFLNPTIKKGPWSENEDIELIKEIIRHQGVKKWSLIVKKVKGRTENALKNRYSLLLEKQKERIKVGMESQKDEIEMWKQYLVDKGILFSGNFQDQLNSKEKQIQSEETTQKKGNISESLSKTNKPQGNGSFKIFQSSAFSVYKEPVPEHNLEQSKNSFLWPNKYLVGIFIPSQPQIQQ